MFCTVYALILPAITWNNNSNLTINGREVKSSYVWSDGAGIFDITVDIVGNIDFDGRVPRDAEPYLKIDVNNDNDTSDFEAYINDRDVLPYATFKLHLWLDGVNELDISSCTANVSMKVDKQKLAAATPMRASADEAMSEEAAAMYGGYALSEIDAMLIEITDGKSDLAAIEMSADNSVLTFSQNAASTFAVVGDTTNPSYTLQHYINMPQVVVDDRLPQGWNTNGYRSPITNRVYTYNNFNYSRYNSTTPLLGFINPHSAEVNAFDVIHTYSSTGLTNGSQNPSLLVPRLKYVGGASQMTKGAIYEFETAPILTKAFLDLTLNYRTSPQIGYMSLIYNNFGDFNVNYTLSEVWVYQPPENGTAKSPDQLVESDFVKYDVPVKKLDNESFTRHDPEQIRFTNNPSNPYISAIDSNGKPIKNTDFSAYKYTYTILIQEGTVIRLVHENTQGEHTRNANFFDYDIGDGFIYSAANRTDANRRPTSSQTNTRTWYMYTNKSGINSNDNYSDRGINNTLAHYAFGNTNSGSGWYDEYFNGYKMNGANTSGFMLTTFGFAKSMTPATDTSLPEVIWNDKIVAPDLFSLNGAIGKTVYATANPDEASPYQIRFNRSGGTYTLSSVVKSDGTTVAQNLNQLQIVYNYQASWMSSPKTIFSNDFWPLDNSPSHGTDGHDMKFGDTNTQANGISSKRKFFGYATGNLPTMDIAENTTGIKPQYDHNSYFGMSYYIEFQIVPGYCSPLNYWFFGDDDMYVFLRQVDDNGNTVEGTEPILVSDIGGVHSAVGQYVNLWNYIEPVPYGGQSKKYRLTVFYTERGASGSTCFMRFTVPMAVRDLDPPDRSEALVVEKELLDKDGKVIDSGNKWLYVDGANSGAWQGSSPATESESEAFGSYNYNVSFDGTNYKFDIFYDGKLTAANSTDYNGKGTNFRIWFYSKQSTYNTGVQKLYNSFIDVYFDENTNRFETVCKENTSADTNAGILVTNTNYTFKGERLSSGTKVTVTIPKALIPNVKGDDIEATIVVSNKPNATNYALYSGANSTPYVSWNSSGAFKLPTEADPVVTAEMQAERNKEFVFLLRMMGDNYTSYQDMYYYEKFNRSVTPDHKNAGPAEVLESGTLGGRLANGYFVFTLKADEYIVIHNLPPETTYSVAEVGENGVSGISVDTVMMQNDEIVVFERDSNGNIIPSTIQPLKNIKTGLESYVTSYQEGLHYHDGNGQAVDLISDTKNYSRIAGQWPPIKLMDHNYVRFSNGPALKTEISPGDDVNLKVGDEIVYELDWSLDMDNEEGKVEIIDKLDPSVDFAGIIFSSKAAFTGLNDAEIDIANTPWESTVGADGVIYRDVSSDGKRTRVIRYDAVERAIICEIIGIGSAEDFDSIFIKVRVNENAETGEVDEITNQAVIKVGNNTITTNTVRNPVWKPVKTEETPGENKTVLPKDRITYRISWKNYKLNAAEVTVWDYLDAYVSFNITDSTVYIMNVDNDGNPILDAGGNKTYAVVAAASPHYDQANSIAWWELGAVPAGAEGYVELTVTVNDDAITRDDIINKGAVQVGNDEKVDTNEVRNPLYRQLLPSTGGSGTLIFTICGLAVMLASLIAGCILQYKRREEGINIR